MCYVTNVIVCCDSTTTRLAPKELNGYTKALCGLMKILLSANPINMSRE